MAEPAIVAPRDIPHVAAAIPPATAPPTVAAAMSLKDPPVAIVERPPTKAPIPAPTAI